MSIQTVIRSFPPTLLGILVIALLVSSISTAEASADSNTELEIFVSEYSNICSFSNKKRKKKINNACKKNQPLRSIFPKSKKCRNNTKSYVKKHCDSLSTSVQGPYQCQLVKTITEYEDSNLNETGFECFGERLDDLSGAETVGYQVDGSLDGLKDEFNSASIRFPTSKLNLVIKNFNLNEGSIIIDGKTTFSLSPIIELRAEKLRAESSDRKALVVYITQNGTSPSPSKQEIQNFIFGSQPESISSLYSSCSYDAINLEPFSSTINNIQNGIVDAVVSVADKSDTEVNESISPSDIRDAANDLLFNTRGLNIENLVKSNELQHVLYVLPPGTGTRKWIANAGTNHWLSQYNDTWILSSNSVAHELGHNLGLGHAGENVYRDSKGRVNNQYDDWVGNMSSGESGWTQKCFNAAKSNQLGWYSSTKVALSPNEVWFGNVVGLTHYEESKLPVIVEAKRGDQDDRSVYISYNHASGINGGTEEAQNQVTIVEDWEQRNNISNLLAKLSAGESYTYENFYGDGEDLDVHVDSITSQEDIPMARVRVGNSAFGYRGGSVFQSSARKESLLINARRARDGITNGNFYAGSVTHTASGDTNPRWLLDLGADIELSQLIIHNRSDGTGAAAQRLDGLRIEILDDDREPVWFDIRHWPEQKQNNYFLIDDINVSGRFVRLSLPGNQILSLAEVEVIPTEEPLTAYPVDQYGFNLNYCLNDEWYYGSHNGIDFDVAESTLPFISEYESVITINGVEEVFRMSSSDKDAVCQSTNEAYIEAVLGDLTTTCKDKIEGGDPYSSAWVKIPELKKQRYRIGQDALPRDVYYFDKTTVGYWVYQGREIPHGVKNESVAVPPNVQSAAELCEMMFTEMAKDR